VEQARRPAPLGLRPELRRPRLVQRRAERQGDGRGAVQGDGRRGRHRGPGRHPLQRPAIERKRGLDQALAENPKIKLLDVQVANWVQTEALEKTNAWLTQFGDQIKGIWAANDDMALGAIEALRADGRAGKVPVTGIDGIQLAVEAIIAGEMAGTVSWDPYWQGGMGLSLGYHAKTGKFDPAKEPQERREFYGRGVVVTAENAKSTTRRTSRRRPSSTGATSGAG
jgi:ABC-type sugar transport system substrate-binding protein